MFQSAAFQIKDSTIYYPDVFGEYRYELKGDSVFIHRDDGVSGSAIVKLTADTLILSTFGQEAVYSRSETQ
ncbi:MAG: hypothetical protein HY562_00115 [Ignavibacteriales bacterium]|nr:hypothetical protein [Ignavibacteriales bacterium]